MVCSFIEQVGEKRQETLLIYKVTFQESQDPYRTFKGCAGLFGEYDGIPCFPVIC